MPRLPDTTFGRLGLLIASVALALFLLVLLALRQFGLGPSGGIYADLVLGNVRLARTEGAVLPANVVRSATAPSRSHEAVLPAQSLIRERVRREFGRDAALRFAEGSDSRVWIQAAPGEDWIGVRVPAFLAQSVGLGIWLFACAALAVLLAAWFFARHLTRPLVRLAETVRRHELQTSGPLPEDPQAPREVRELQAALADAAARQQASVREREMLLAGVSHDLRTPLARLRLALELQSRLPDGDRELMVGDVNEMDAIVGQFLDFVRDGRDEPVQDSDLVSLLHELVRDAGRAGHVWTLDVPDRCERRIRPLALRRALANLMGNAQLHGRAPFRLALLTGVTETVLAVEDSGPGLPEGLRERVGQAFLRAAPGRTGSAGSGLGLALVDRVARTHAGRLELSDRPDGGCLARIVLPAG